MAIAAPPPAVDVDARAAHPQNEPVGARTHRVLGSLPTAVLWVIVVIWTIPTIGLLVTSLRPEADQFGAGWWTIVTNPSLTADHYDNALFNPPGGSLPFSDAFLNSFAIAIPGTLVPIAIAAAAAYALAWMDFKGRHWLFIGVLAMMAVPLQMALVPLQQSSRRPASTAPGTSASSGGSCCPSPSRPWRRSPSSSSSGSGTTTCWRSSSSARTRMRARSPSSS
jgi:alpha-glucoside transport system permease protein